MSFTANGNNPVPYFAGNTAMNTPEGCASVSDDQGNLLFYTNGKTVFTRHHLIMPNGDSLLGHMSAQQSCLIVPMPGNDNLFYIFTADAIENSFPMAIIIP